MGIFDKIKEPVFLKEDSMAENQLSQLEELRKSANDETAKAIETEISYVKAGIYGEQTIHYELKNSHIPMLIIHDLYLEHNGLSAQIDYMIFTRSHIYVVECKNLYGNIEINNRGDFIRTFGSGRNAKKEGIYSPITQNQRHLELIKSICLDSKNGVLAKKLFEKQFYNSYRSIVVIANPKTILYDRYADMEVRSKVIRCDKLVDYIKRLDKADNCEMSEKTMLEIADFFLHLHKEKQTDYVKKFRDMIENRKEAEAAEEADKSEDKNAEAESSSETKSETLICPRCGAQMIKRKATKGANAGKEFYGCSNFPKCRCIIAID